MTRHCSSADTTIVFVVILLHYWTCLNPCGLLLPASWAVWILSVEAECSCCIKFLVKLQKQQWNSFSVLWNWFYLVLAGIFMCRNCQWHSLLFRANGVTVGWGTVAQDGRCWVRFPSGVLGHSQVIWSLCLHPVALGSTHPLTVPRNFCGHKVQAHILSPPPPPQTFMTSYGKDLPFYAFSPSTLCASRNSYSNKDVIFAVSTNVNIPYHCWVSFTCLIVLCTSTLWDYNIVLLLLLLSYVILNFLMLWKCSAVWM
jgi:hypothetical protein